MTPIILKLAEVVKHYSFREKQQNLDINNDQDVDNRLWPHPSRSTTITEIETRELAQRCKPKESTVQMKMELDQDVEFKYWPHPAHTVTIEEVKNEEDATITAYADGSKQNQEVGSGLAIFKGSNMIANAKLKLNTRCSNNQA
jgi:hypothetical protein